MVEVTTARGTYRYVYDALGRADGKQHISLTGKPYNPDKILWDGMRLAQESRPEEQAACISTATRGVMNRWRGVDKADIKGPGTRCCIFHRM